MIDKLLSGWKVIQEFLSIDGGLYIDAFAIVFIVRLLAPLRGFPPVSNAEAGLWAATISAFAYSGKGPKQS